jgi:hypothetical protein
MALSSAITGTGRAASVPPAAPRGRPRPGRLLDHAHPQLLELRHDLPGLVGGEGLVGVHPELRLRDSPTARSVSTSSHPPPLPSGWVILEPLPRPRRSSPGRLCLGVGRDRFGPAEAEQAVGRVHRASWRRGRAGRCPGRRAPSGAGSRCGRACLRCPRGPGSRRSAAPRNTSGILAVVLGWGQPLLCR